MARRRRFGRELLDVFLLVMSWVSILGSIVAQVLIFMNYGLETLKPYVLLSTVFVLGIVGYRVWRRENVD